jgi:hypothetical protein
MCGTMTIPVNATAPTAAAHAQSDAIKNIVQHVLTLAFGRQRPEQAGIFVTIYQDYRKADWIR